MTLADVLLSPSLAAALAVYGVLSLALAILGARAEARLEDGAQGWLWDHFYAPLLRAGTVCVFILMAYPALFGLASAPPVTALLAADDARTGHLLGLVLALSLATPLLPLRYAGPALALPLQGIAAATLLFHWLRTALGAGEAGLWVGLPTLAIVVVLALATHVIAIHVLDGVQRAGVRLLGIGDLDTALREILVLAIQVPVILVYTLGLGAGLPPAAG